MDILFLILLSGFLLHRLWTTLGTKTGEEKQRSFDLKKDDTIIVLPKKHPYQNDAPDEDIDTEDELPAYQKQRLSKIMDKIPDFDGLEFLDNAKMAYKMIIESFMAGDKERLKKLLSNDAYKSFDDAINQRKKDKIRYETEIVDFLSAEIEKSDVYEDEKGADIGQIVVLFKTKQIAITYNSDDQIIENPAKISIIQKDRWTFERAYLSESPIWLLVKTKTL